MLRLWHILDVTRVAMCSVAWQVHGLHAPWVAWVVCTLRKASAARAEGLAVQVSETGVCKSAQRRKPSAPNVPTTATPSALFHSKRNSSAQFLEFSASQLCLQTTGTAGSGVWRAGVIVHVQRVEDVEKKHKEDTCCADGAQASARPPSLTASHG